MIVTNILLLVVSYLLYLWIYFRTTVPTVRAPWPVLRSQSPFAETDSQGAYAAAQHQGAQHHAAHHQAAHRQAAQHPVAQHKAAHRVLQAVQDTSSTGSTITGTVTMDWISN